jgi:hypothetical protein
MKPTSIPPDQRPVRSSSPVETPTFGPGGNHSIICSTTIRAPISTVLTALLDTRTYPAWNRFCPRITIDSQPPPAPANSHNPAGKDAASSPAPALPADINVDPSVADLPTTLRRDTAFTEDVHLNPAAPPSNGRDIAQPLRVTLLEEFRTGDGRRGVRLAWCTRGRWISPSFVLKSERVQELVEKRATTAEEEEEGDGGGGAVGKVEYICWETFYGVLGPVVSAVVGKTLLKGFAAWMDGLKEYAEKQVGHAETETTS